METVLVDSTLNGLTNMQQLGLAGLFLSFIFIGGIAIIYYFAKNCDRRTEQSIASFKDESVANRSMFKEESAANRAVIEKNTEAFNGVQIALARIEVKVGQ